MTPPIRRSLPSHVTHWRRFVFVTYSAVWLGAIVLCAGQRSVAETEPPRRNATTPNFVLILTDDQGWTGTSVAMRNSRDDARSDYHLTPSLERLARQGMRFSQGYAPAPLCSPTRRSIQFGQTPLRQGDEQFAARYLPSSHPLTIPRALKAVDPQYRAAHFGKWDLRSDLAPEHLGYDVSDGDTGNGDGNKATQFDKSDKWTRFKTLDDPKQIFGLTARANRFMEEQVNAGRPFFVQISHYAVHADVQTTPESLTRQQARPPGHVHRRPEFGAMTADLDDGLGKLLDCIAALGVADSTYIIYLADNGAVPWVPPDKAKHVGHPSLVEQRSNNWPLRAGKWTLFEGGVRVPWVIAGPGIAPDSWCDVPVIGWDLLPTIADLAGYRTPLPEDIDGGVLSNLLMNHGAGTVVRPMEGLVFHYYSSGIPHSSIRMGDDKLIKFWQPPPFDNDAASDGSGSRNSLLLFDLQEDPGETRNLAEIRPERAKQLDELLTDYCSRMGIASDGREN